MTERKDQPLILGKDSPVEFIPARTLHRKLAEVMAEAERIPKNGTAPAVMGGFKFVQVGDAADIIRKALAIRKVSMLPSAVEVVGEAEHQTSSQKTMTTMTVRTTWTLVDGESGETAVIQSLGTGADTGDKYSPKAQTNAMKYALLMGFLLSTGDDPEQTDTSDRQARRNGAQAASNAPEIDQETGGLIGIAGASGKDDFELRQEANRGWALPFRLTSGRKSFKVVAFGLVAEALATAKADVLNKRVTVWGTFQPKSFPKKQPDGTTKTIEYQVLELERIATADWILPAEEALDGELGEDLAEADLQGVEA